MYDIIIIGAGPAGISASLYAKRANMKVLVLYYGKSEIEEAVKIDNYYGFINGISGIELYNNGIKQAQNLGIELIEKEVLNIVITDNSIFNIKTKDEIFSSKSIILATGNNKIKSSIKGADNFEGKGISYCAICDGFFYKNQNVVVIGNGQYALNEANELSNIVKTLKIFTNGLDKPLSKKYEIDTRKIKEIHGDSKVTSIEFEDGELYNVDGIFIAQGIAGGLDFAKKIGIITQNSFIKVNEKMETNIKGIFSCGNITGGLLQINKAVYEGAKAGINAVKYIKES